MSRTAYDIGDEVQYYKPDTNEWSRGVYKITKIEITEDDVWYQLNQAFSCRYRHFSLKRPTTIKKGDVVLIRGVVEVNQGPRNIVVETESGRLFNAALGDLVLDTSGDEVRH